jgi:hypothetical protein
MCICLDFEKLVQLIKLDIEKKKSRLNRIAGDSKGLKLSSVEFKMLLFRKELDVKMLILKKLIW